MLTKVAINRIKKQIATILQANVGIAPTVTHNLLPISNLQGKLYEAHILAIICEKLVTIEKLSITLVNGKKLVLKQKGSSINRNYPYFQVWNGSDLFGELFTDVYFNTLSYQRKGSPSSQENGDYHELDIALLKPNQTKNPPHSEIMLAVECKNTSIKKNIIRELLGFRRELSLLASSQRTHFSKWPTRTTNSKPNSVHMLYCSDKNIGRYNTNCLQFGILLEHHSMI
jgi:hypothetical protein